MFETEIIQIRLPERSNWSIH